MKTRSYQGTWRNQKAEEKYRQAAKAGWDQAVTPPQSLDIPTRFGPTRVYRWAGDGPAVVFFHGMSDTSVRWIPFAEELDGFDVYAVDIMGDVGHSKHEVGFTSADDYAIWLEETINGLGLNQPSIVGHSLGGYVALRYAIHAATMPEGQAERIASVVAFDPVGMVKLRLVRFMMWGFGNMLAAYMPGPIRRPLARYQRMPLINDKPAMKLLQQAQFDHPPKLPPLTVFTDEQLASIDVPVRVVVGAKSSAFDIPKMVERTNTIIPKGQAHVIPDAGHAVTATHFEECLAAVQDVLPADVC